MLKLQKARTLTTAVDVRFPLGDNSYETQSFKATFRFASESEMKEHFKELKQDETDATVLDKVLVGVEGVGDENGEALDTAVALQMVKDDPFCARAALAKYFELVNKEPRKSKS